MARIKIIFLFLTVLCISIYSQNKNRTNLEIFENIISSELEKFYFYPGISRNDEFVFIVNPSGSGGNNDKQNISRFLSSVIKKTAGSNKLRFSIIAANEDNVSPDTNKNIITLQVNNLQTVYTGFKKNKFLGSKTLERNIKIDIGVNIISSGTANLSEKIFSDYRDEINYDDYEQLQESDYDFTKASAPKLSTFETVIFPVLLIVVSAAATILFFTIRSK